MKRHRFTRLVWIVSLFGLLSLLDPALNQVRTVSGATTWQVSVIDSANDVGLFPSLALQPGTDKPYISYYDSTQGDLKLAFPVSGGGDCGPGNSWSCNSLNFQNTTDFGLDSSLDFNSLGQWGIAYQTLALGTNDFRGIPATGAQELFWDPIEQPTSAIVRLNNFRFNASDIGHVSYGLFDVGLSKAYIKHAKYVGLGGNCGGGLWECEVVVETSPTGLAMFNSLAFYNNLPHIFYRDSNQRLSMAVNNSVNDCGLVNGWQCSSIDSAMTVAGLISSYINAQEEKLAVAYIGNTSLRYAYVVPTGAGNCGNSLYEFRCMTIDSVGSADNNQWMAASLGVSNGQPVIAYTDTNDRGNTVLKIAYPKANGNCGPFDTALRRTWQCDPVDSSANDVGYYPSLQVDTQNRIHIAYYDYTAGNLKYAVSTTALIPRFVYLPLIMR